MSEMNFEKIQAPSALVVFHLWLQANIHCLPKLQKFCLEIFGKWV